MKKKLDAIDRKILGILQQNAETPLADMAQAVNLSSTPCWRRIQRLHEHGFITQKVALLDPHKINLAVTAFVAVRTNQHSQARFEGFRPYPKTMRIEAAAGLFQFNSTKPRSSDQAGSAPSAVITN